MPEKRTLRSHTTPEARTMAEERSLALLRNTIRTTKDTEALLSFAYECADVLGLDARKHKYLDNIAGALEVEATYPGALKALRGKLLDFTSERAFSLENTSTAMFKKFKPISASSVQGELDQKAENARRAANSFKGGCNEMRCGVSKLGIGVWDGLLKPSAVVLKTITVGALRGVGGVGGFVGHTAKAVDHMIKAGLERKGIHPLKRWIAYGGVLAALTIGATMPIDASPYAHILHGNSTSITASATPEEIKTSGLTRAFAEAVKPRNASGSLTVSSSMQALTAGISPVAQYFITILETNGGRDVIADNSTASGLYQSLVPTKLEWIARYGSKTQMYQEASARLKAGSQSPQDKALLTAIDATKQQYASDQRGLIARVQSRQVPQAINEAMNLADSTVFGGQLAAQHLRETAPELVAAGNNLDKIMGATSDYYMRHLLGETGGKFVNWLADAHPSTRMNDKAALERLYKQYPGRVASFDNRVGTYYVGVAARNGGVFKQGAGVTARQYESNVRTYVSERIAEPARNIRTALAHDTAQNTQLASRTTQPPIARETTTYAEIGMKMVENSIPAPVKQASLEAGKLAASAFNKAVQYLSPDEAQPPARQQARSTRIQTASARSTMQPN